MTVIQLTGFRADREGEAMQTNHYGKPRFERKEQHYIGGYHVINLTDGEELLEVRVFDTGKVATCCIWVRLKDRSVSATVSVGGYGDPRRMTAVSRALGEIFQIRNLGHFEGSNLVFTLLESAGRVVAESNGAPAHRIKVLENHA